MYSPPLTDIRFVLSELADLESVCALPGFEDVSPDLVDAVLTENARLMQDVVAPLNRTGDTVPARWEEGVVVTPPGYRDAFRQFVAGGWQGVPHPPAMGGQGLPHLVAAACVENVNSANMAFALVTLLSDGVVDALLTAGSPEQQQRYIPPLLGGRLTGTMNLTEPQAGSDLAQIRTRAEPQADGSYRIFGQKIFITYGEHDLADNILHLVLARTPDAPPGIKGISLFLVPKFLPHDGAREQHHGDDSAQHDDTPGPRNDVYCASIEHKLGIHGSPTAVMVYGDDQGEVGAGAIGYRVGEENHGLQYMFVMMNAARYAVGLQGVAISERACQQALAYARERVQSRAIGSTNAADTIDQHPDVQRMLLTMRALTESSRALAYVAAADDDRAHHHADADQRRQAAARYEYLVPIIKGFATESAQEVTSLGVQVHGGMGFIEETGMAQYYRDARILPIYEGTTAIQANDLLGRKTLRDGGQVALSFLPGISATVAELRDAGGELTAIADRLEAAANDYQAVVEHLVATGESAPRAAYAGSVPYLMLAGLVHGGWHMARAALACHRTDPEQPFRANKRRVARFHALHLLPRTMALRQAILAGGDAVTALEQE